MKKFNSILALLLAILIPVTQSQAQVLSVNSAIDELNYALTVQWDQKVIQFHDQAIRRFTAEMQTLQSQGVTTQEVVQSIKAKLPDAQFAKDLDTLIRVAQEKHLSVNQIQTLVVNSVSKIQTSGASFSSDASTVAGLAVAGVMAAGAVVLIVYIIVQAVNSKPSTGPQCYYDNQGVGHYCYN